MLKCCQNLSKTFIAMLRHFWCWKEKSPKRFKTFFYLIICVSLNFITIYYNFFAISETINPILINTTCYSVKDRYINLKADETLNTSAKSIFFLETSCKGGLNSRQACAVESASKANPDWNIFVLLTGPLYINEAVTILSSMENVQFARLNVTAFSKGTKIEQLYLKNIFSESYFPVVHHSDVLRLLTLNKYGGFYLDLDVIVMKSFNDLPKDFVTKQSMDELSSGILRLSKDGVGKLFTDLALEDLSVSYAPKLWSANGPKLFSRIMSNICNNSILSQWSAETCQGMEVFSKEYFYPIEYPNWKKYFEDYDIEETGAYTHHVWNFLGGFTEIKPSSLFAKLARKYCPNVYEGYGSKFGMVRARVI